MKRYKKGKELPYAAKRYNKAAALYDNVEHLVAEKQ